MSEGVGLHIRYLYTFPRAVYRGAKRGNPREHTARTVGDGGVKPDDVISSPGARYGSPRSCAILCSLARPRPKAGER